MKKNDWKNGVIRWVRRKREKGGGDDCDDRTLKMNRYFFMSSIGCPDRHGSDFSYCGIDTATPPPYTHTLTHQVHHDGGAVAVGLSGPVVLWSQQIKSLALPTSSLWQCWRGCLCVSVCDPDPASSVWEAGCLLSSIQGAYPLIRLKAAQDYIRKYS